MAIHPSVRPQQPASGTLTPQQAQQISAWTEQTASALENLEISSVDAGDPATAAAGARRSPSVPLTIPLDDPIPARGTKIGSTGKVRGNIGDGGVEHDSRTTYKRHAHISRDSLNRREALLKGKEGSRRRQRWENDRLLSNPWAQPPTAKDWLIEPTYTRYETVPYYLASLWESHYAHQERSRGSRKSSSHKDTPDEKNQIPKELRRRLKHARGARGLLQDLEEDIRMFMKKWNEKRLILEDEGFADVPSSGEETSSEDEIVFVGRNGQMHDSPERKERFQKIREEMYTHHERNGEKMVFESLAHDRGAVFGRWLVHAIAAYYGLFTWSVTTFGEQARREAYVGFKPPAASGSHGEISFPIAGPVGCRSTARYKPGDPLPKPLWVQI